MTEPIEDIRARLTTIETLFAVGNERVKGELDAIRGDLTRVEDRMVTMERFSPVEKIVYGLVGVTLLAVLTALLARVVAQ